MNEEVILYSFPGIGNVIVSGVFHAVSYLHNGDIKHKYTIPIKVSVSNAHYKSYKYKESVMAFSKKPIVCKLGDLGEARSMYTQTNALTGKSCKTAVHKEA